MPDPLDLARCRALAEEAGRGLTLAALQAVAGGADRSLEMATLAQNTVREYHALTTALHAACDEVERLREALAPFAQPDLVKSHPGAMRDDSAIYGRDKATLRLGDFRRARNVLEAR